MLRCDMAVEYGTGNYTKPANGTCGDIRGLLVLGTWDRLRVGSGFAKETGGLSVGCQQVQAHGTHATPLKLPCHCHECRLVAAAHGSRTLHVCRCHRRGPIARALIECPVQPPPCSCTSC